MHIVIGVDNKIVIHKLPNASRKEATDILSGIALASVFVSGFSHAHLCADDGKLLETAERLLSLAVEN